MTLSFDGTLEGFYTLVHQCYYQKYHPTHIEASDTTQLSFMDITPITTCMEKSAAVAQAIFKKISEEAALRIYYAFLSHDESRFMALLAYIKLGFKLGHMVDSHLTEPCVQKVHKLAREVGGEAHLLFGFSRFVEGENGVYYSPITPKNNVLTLVAEHFATRFGSHPWVVHDKKRHQAAIYNGDAYVITPVPAKVTVTLAPGETELQGMWKDFLQALTIEARKNPKLQRQLLPLYFRKNMTEFL